MQQNNLKEIEAKLAEIDAKLALTSRWTSDDGQDLVMLADVMQCLREELCECPEDTATASYNNGEDIDSLNLSSRARNSLVKNGIRTVKALEGLTYYELLRLPNMGKKTAEEIEEKMKAYKGNPEWKFYR